MLFLFQLKIEVSTSKVIMILLYLDCTHLKCQKLCLDHGYKRVYISQSTIEHCIKKHNSCGRKLNYENLLLFFSFYTYMIVQKKRKKVSM